jgi:tRNA-dihydrouridine synthase C
MVVSAKMRLGYNDTHRALDCARAIVAGGASELVVHARTKADGYRPPAYWEQIAAIRTVTPIPVIANGEIWNVDDARRCRLLSGCDALMLGRGMVSDPGLALAIVAADAGDEDAPGVGWDALQPLLAAFWLLVSSHVEPRARAGRLKQWLHHLRRRYPQAERAYAAVRTINDPGQVAERLGLGPGLGFYPASVRAADLEAGPAAERLHEVCA